MIEFRIDPTSGLSPSWQLVRQVRYALRLGLLREGDQLPTVKALADQLRVNQNTVLKAYRELEYGGLVSPQPGVGTFIRVTLLDASSRRAHGSLREQLLGWVSAARRAGLDDETIEALFDAALRDDGPDGERVTGAPLAS